MQKKCIYVENSDFSITYVFWQMFRNKYVSFQNLGILNTKGVACLFGRLGRHEARQQKRTWWERIICTKISPGATTPWCIAAQIHLLGHCGLHSPGIDWVVKRLEPVAWLCSRVYGWIGTFHFFEHNGPKNKRGNSRNKRGNLRNKRGNSLNGVQCGFWCWIALLRATCWHWRVASMLYLKDFTSVMLH